MASAFLKNCNHQNRNLEGGILSSTAAEQAKTRAFLYSFVRNFIIGKRLCIGSPRRSSAFLTRAITPTAMVYASESRGQGICTPFLSVRTCLGRRPFSRIAQRSNGLCTPSNAKQAASIPTHSCGLQSRRSGKTKLSMPHQLSRPAAGAVSRSRPFFQKGMA